MAGELVSLFRILTWPLPFKGYFRRQLIAIDQAFNVLLNGQPDETLSSRLGRDKAEGSGFADAACDILGAFEKDHCEKSIEFTTTGEPDAHHLGKRAKTYDDLAATTEAALARMEKERSATRGTSGNLVQDSGLSTERGQVEDKR